MILGHHTLKNRIDDFFPRLAPFKIGASSVDVSIGCDLIAEDRVRISIIDNHAQYPWIIEPGEFVLVSMREHVYVPNDVSCMFLLKSSAARAGWGHSFAGWIDPGWDGILTMELKNYNQNTPLPIWPGMPIGQLIYMQTSVAGTYKGRYQHSVSVSGVREEIEYDAGS